jgi:hypothetical protein
MTERYLGSIISPSPVEPSEGFADSTASGVWNVHDPLIFGQAGDWPDPTNASPSKFIENLFSCFAYTGNSGSQTITNGIDLSNEGGLVWIKCRTQAENHRLFDTERGATYYLTSNSTAQHYAGFNQAFTSSGFSFNSDDASVNENNLSYMSWTFRKQPKFFDVVTYSGTGSARTVSHNLGSVPGMIIVKRTDSATSWNVYHNGLNGGTNPEQYGINLNTTGAEFSSSGYWNNTAPTATEFTVGTSGNANASGGTYVAYLFAHNNSDGGFGSTGDQDIIKCGSYTGNGSSSNAITLGFEPQWIMIKNATASANWILFDNVRGIHTGADDEYMFADTTAAGADGELIEVTADGFRLTANNSTTNNSSQTYIYMAIRRGPMITPTAGTQVFFADLITANQTGRSETGIGFSPDVIVNLVRSRANHGQQICNRVTGPLKQLFTNYNSAEQTSNGQALQSFDMDGYTLGADTAGNGWNAYSGDTSVKHCFKRAPGFLDVVAYSGDGTSSRNIKHNLTVAPELILLKNRTSGGGGAGWKVGVASLGNDEGALHNGNAFAAYNLITTYSTTTFTAASGDEQINKSGEDYVAFLFATVAGVSKVGTYSGTGSDINVDCGFTSGARFVLAKRTDSSGDWYTWDSARGIVDGNDPYMLYGPGAAVEVTNTDYIDPLSSGFTITSNAQSDLNTSGGTYVFLAIA